MSTNARQSILWNDCWIIDSERFSNYIAWIPKEILEDISENYIQSLFDYLLERQLINWNRLSYNKSVTLDLIC
jgi:hypothetical protein